MALSQIKKWIAQSRTLQVNKFSIHDPQPLGWGSFFVYTAVMSLKETIEKAWRKEDFCPVGRIIKSLSDEDSIAFADAIKNGIPHAVLVRALRQEGHKTSKDSIGAHLHKQCKCVQ